MRKIICAGCDKTFDHSKPGRLPKGWRCPGCRVPRRHAQKCEHPTRALSCAETIAEVERRHAEAKKKKQRLTDELRAASNEEIKLRTTLSVLRELEVHR